MAALTVPVLTDSLSTFAGAGTKSWRRDCAVAGIYWRRRQPDLSRRAGAPAGLGCEKVTAARLRGLALGSKTLVSLQQERYEKNTRMLHY